MILQTVLSIFLVVNSQVWAVELNCEFSEYDWPFLGMSYGCSVLDIHKTDKNALSAIRGHKDRGKGNADVVTFSFWNSDISTIPSAIGFFFPNLKGFEWYRTKLQSISSTDLKQFPKLQYLYLAANRLIALDGDLFRYTRNLKGINFSNNNLQSITDNILDGLNLLEEANFQGNECVKFRAFDDHGFVELKQNFAKNCTNEIEDLKKDVRRLSALQTNNERRFSKLEKQMKEFSLRRRA